MENYCNFKPFDKVLVRYDDQHVWQIDFFSHYVRGVECPYKCLTRDFNQCIPYDGNEHLIDTSDDPEKSNLNKNTPTPKITAKSIVEQAKVWAKSDRNRAAIVLLRNNQTGITHTCIASCDDSSLVETLVTHMLHDEKFCDAVGAANYIIDNHRDQLEAYIKQHQSHS